jgi:hypothetical protein
VLIRDTLTHVSAATGDFSDHVGGVDASGKSKCAICRRAQRHLFDNVGEAPLVYKTDGAPLPKGKLRWARFSANVREVHQHISEYDPAPSGAVEDVPAEMPETAPEVPEATPEPEVKATPKPVAADVRRRAEEFYRQVQNRRAFVRGRKLESLDSMRVIIDGTKAVKAGVPVVALISSIEAPWTADTRAQAASYRPSASELKPEVPAGTYDYGTFAPRPSRFAHATSEYVARLVKADVPVWLHGPAGTGKSSAAHYAAETLGLDYYEVNLAGAMVSAIKGKDRLKEFVESDAMRAYEFGGLLCLEEFDSAHPTVGTALNTMLAGSEYHNDADGRTIKRHPNFRCVVTANSLGYGSPEFKRQDLDAATKDRFRMGRVYMGLDLDLERAIFDSILETA